MTATEKRLILFAVRSYSLERMDLTTEVILRDIDLKLHLGLKEGDIRRLTDELVYKPLKLLPSQLLGRPTKWSPVGYAHDGDGHDCDPKDPHAVCWSLEGALECCDCSKDAIRQLIHPVGLDEFNRTAGYTLVVALLRSIGL